jgi:hypothetical protein
MENSEKMIDLSKYSIEELVELKNKIASTIYAYEDGYFYICNVRSYGRNWNDKGVYNTHTLQELCHLYYGEDGIVDVFSNNPDLSKIDNYGKVMFVPTEKDYEVWKEYEYLKNFIPGVEEELDKWNNRDNVPFRERPHFEPIYTREYAAKMKLKLENFDMSYIAPVSVKRVYEDEDEETC